MKKKNGKLKIKNRQLLPLLNGLSSLDGQGQRDKPDTFNPYVFGHARLPYHIGCNTEAVAKLFQAFDKGRIAAVNRILETHPEKYKGKTALEGDELKKFREQWTEVEEEEIEIDLFTIKLSDLNIASSDNPGGNKLPGSVLRELAPILIDDTPDDEGEAEPADGKVEQMPKPKGK